MVWLPNGEEILMIYLFVLTQLTNVTDRQTHTERNRHRMTAQAALMHSFARQKLKGVKQDLTQSDHFYSPQNALQRQCSLHGLSEGQGVAEVMSTFCRT